MRILVVVMAACLLFAACSSSNPASTNPASTAPSTGADAAAETGTAPGAMDSGPNATTSPEDANSLAEATGPAADVGTANPDDAASGTDAEEAGGLDAESAEAAPIQDAGQTGDAGMYGPNWKLVCPNTMPAMTCCSVYCACMAQRCATESPPVYGSEGCMAWCLKVGPTLKRSAVSSGIQFLVCECSEAGNPAVPFDWHSHCGHALDMNGGTCKY
jgi:hypothetical protein